MRTWAEVDLSALEHNYRTLRAMLAPGCRFLGLCKANAYGHGAAAVGRKLEELGADMLAVACISEAEELRRSGVRIPILCLGETPEACFPLLLEYQVTQMVEDLETGRRLSQAAQKAGKTLKIHVKLDTGMSRLGFFSGPGAGGGDGGGDRPAVPPARPGGGGDVHPLRRRRRQRGVHHGPADQIPGCQSRPGAEGYLFPNLPLRLQRRCVTVSLYPPGHGAAGAGAVRLLPGGGAEGGWTAPAWRR